ncbi:MAG: class I SAM-dependent methyltransferase [Methylococcales bacterium]
MITQQLFRRFYPDSRHDGTRAFYGWVRQYTGADTVMLNLGAGPATGNPVRVFKGEVARVVGADIDPIVLENSELDEAHIIVHGSLPVPTDGFDIVLSDYVLEHVAQPRQVMSEVHRVLKPGGSFFFRTPNKYHYVSLIARATPHWFHNLFANRVRGLIEDPHEPYPTYHRMNSRKSLQRIAQGVGFGSMAFRMIEAQPSYLMFHALPFLMGVVYERTVNRYEVLAGLRANIFGRLVK